MESFVIHGESLWLYFSPLNDGALNVLNALNALNVLNALRLAVAVAIVDSVAAESTVLQLQF